MKCVLRQSWMAGWRTLRILNFQQEISKSPRTVLFFFGAFKRPTSATLCEYVLRKAGPLMAEIMKYAKTVVPWWTSIYHPFKTWPNMSSRLKCQCCHSSWQSLHTYIAFSVRSPQLWDVESAAVSLSAGLFWPLGNSTNVTLLVMAVLRGSWASNSQQKGKDFGKAQLWTGHKNRSLTWGWNQSH